MNEAKDLVIKGAELTQLVAYLENIPTKYGMSIINFINEVSGKRESEVKADKAEAPVASPVAS